MSTYDSTPNLNIRKLTTADSPDFFSAIRANRDFLSIFEPHLVDIYHSEKAVSNDLSILLNPRSHHFGIFICDEFAGDISINDRYDDILVGRFSYWLQEKFTGNGYAALALHSMTHRLAYRYHWYEADVLPENVASIRTLERNNFELDRQTRAGYLKYELCVDDIPGIGQVSV